MAYVEYPKPKVPNGYQALPVGSTGVKLTVPSGTRHAVLRVATNAVRYRDDGPTAANTTTGGIKIGVDEIIELTSPQQISQFTAISTGATGMIEASYYKS